MRQAITTKYLGPTNSRGSRIKATASAGSVTIPYDYAGSSHSRHAKAAKTLADKLGWSGLWIGGGMPSETGCVYVTTGHAAIWPGSDPIEPKDFAHFAGREGEDWFMVEEAAA